MLVLLSRSDFEWWALVEICVALTSSLSFLCDSWEFFCGPEEATGPVDLFDFHLPALGRFVLILENSVAWARGFSLRLRGRGCDLEWDLLDRSSFRDGWATRSVHGEFFLETCDGYLSVVAEKFDDEFLILVKLFFLRLRHLFDVTVRGESIGQDFADRRLHDLALDHLGCF